VSWCGGRQWSKLGIKLAACSSMARCCLHGDGQRPQLRQQDGPDLHRHPVQLWSIDKACIVKSHQIGLLSTMLSFHDLSGKPRSKRCRLSCKHRSNGKMAPSTGDLLHHPHPANPTSLKNPPTAQGSATAQRGSCCGTHKRKRNKGS
jgi:hypothetical protein